MRVVGLDIHRVFAEAVMLKDGTVQRLGRIGMTRDHLAAFAQTLTHDDAVVIEATGNASAVAEVIRPHVGRVVIANPRQVRLIAEARIKTDVIDATVLARLYASGFLPEVWVPDEHTLGLRRQVTRRTQIVRQRARLKTIAQSILHAHLVPPCPHADLFGPRGRAWLQAQPLPADESDALERHLREYDRLTDDLRVVERELARDALVNPNVKRLMTIPGIDMVVADGLMAAIGPIERFSSPGPTGGLSRPEPHRASVRRRPAAARADQQAGPHPCPDHAGRSGLASGTRTRTAAGLLSTCRKAPRNPHCRCCGGAQTGCHHLASAQTRRRLRLGPTGATRQEASRSGASLRQTGASWPAGCSLRLQSEPDPRRREASRRAG